MSTLFSPTTNAAHVFVGVRTTADMIHVGVISGPDRFRFDASANKVEFTAGIISAFRPHVVAVIVEHAHPTAELACRLALQNVPVALILKSQIELAADDAVVVAAIARRWQIEGRAIVDAQRRRIEVLLDQPPVTRGRCWRPALSAAAAALFGVAAWPATEVLQTQAEVAPPFGLMAA